MSRPLIYQPEAWTTVESTFRCAQGRYLMSPGSESNRRVLGVLGRALHLYGESVKLIFAGGTSNHLHLILKSETPQARAAFKCHVKTNLSKELGHLFDFPEGFFGRRCRDIPILDDEALRQRLMYASRHCMKEGLVSTMGCWPGVQWPKAVTEGRPLKGVWYDRSRLFEMRRKWEAADAETRGNRPSLKDVAETYVVKLTPPDFMADLDEAAQRAQWTILFEAAVERYPAPPGEPLGRAAIEAQDPQTRPKHTKRTPAPLVHATDPARAREWRTAYRAFVAAWRLATDRLRRGLKDFEFPAGGVVPSVAQALATPMAAPG